MRVCFISNFFPPAGISGADRSLWNIVHKFAEKGIKVEVITVAPKQKKYKKVERKKNILIHRLPLLDPNNKGDLIKKGKTLYKYLEKIAKSKKIDIISSECLHLWNRMSPAFCSLSSTLVSINYGIPNVLTIRSELLHEENKIAPKNLLWDKIVCVSEAVADQVHELGMDVDKIVVGYSGVDLNEFKPGLGYKWLRSRIGFKEKDRVILFAGRLSEAKGLPTLLKAFSIITKNKRNVKLLLAAARSQEKSEKEFNKLIEETYEKAEILGIRKHLFIKPFELEDMPKVYNGCDIFCLPTQTEGFGSVFVEAMACGLPVIGTSVGGVPEIITNGEDGYLLGPNDPSELAKRLEWLLISRKKRILMGRNGVKKVKNNFDLNKTTEKLLGVYKSIISKNIKKTKTNNKKSVQVELDIKQVFSKNKKSPHQESNLESPGS